NEGTGPRHPTPILFANVRTRRTERVVRPLGHGTRLARGAALPRIGLRAGRDDTRGDANALAVAYAVRIAHSDPKRNALTHAGPHAALPRAHALPPPAPLPVSPRHARTAP